LTTTIQRILLAFLIVFIGIFAVDFIVGHTLLKADYDAIRPQLRPKDGSRFGQNWFFLSELTLLIPFVLLYIKTSAQRSTLPSSLLYGFTAGLLAHGHVFFFYGLMPLPLELCLKWLSYGLTKCLLCALLLHCVLGQTKRSADELQ
jgi:hypothetical protein